MEWINWLDAQLKKRWFVEAHENKGGISRRRVTPLQALILRLIGQHVYSLTAAEEFLALQKREESGKPPRVG